MDKSEILAAIKKKVYYAELPSKMHVSVMDDTLHLIIDADGVLQNMQNDASAFEGVLHQVIHSDHNRCCH